MLFQIIFKLIAMTVEILFIFHVANGIHITIQVYLHEQIKVYLHVNFFIFHHNFIISILRSHKCGKKFTRFHASFVYVNVELHINDFVLSSNIIFITNL